MLISDLNKASRVTKTLIKVTIAKGSNIGVGASFVLSGRSRGSVDELLYAFFQKLDESDRR